MDSPSKTISAKRRRLLRALLLALGLFAVAGVFFYVAYLEVKTESAPGTTIPPLHVQSSPSATRINGVYTREKNPGHFWGLVIFHVAISLGCAGFGFGVLWEEHIRRRYERYSSEIRREQ